MSHRNSHKRLPVIAALLAVTLLSACGIFGPAEPQPVAATQLFAEQQCPIDLDGPYPATAVYASVQDLGVSRWMSALGDTDADQASRMLILVHAGSKPNPGHGIALHSAGAVGDELHINMIHHRPDPNRMYAQVLIQPCVLIKVPTREYKRLVVDEVQPTGG